MTIWHWVRHGPTHQKSFCGWRDVPADLTDLAAMARLNAALPTGALVIASDLIRASATADCLSFGRTRLPDDRALREMHFGDWEGLEFAKVSQRDPDLSRAFWEEPGDVAAPGGESWNRTAARVTARVAEINAAWPEAQVIAVAHVGVILTQVQLAQSVPAAEAIGHRIDNLSVTELHHGPDGWQVRRINHCP